MTLYNNYAPHGLTQPSFPGATISNHSWNGTLETAYGVADWWELGLYLPVYALSQTSGGPQFDAARSARCSSCRTPRISGFSTA